VEVLPIRLEPTSKYVGFYSHQVIFQANGPAIGTRGAIFNNGLESNESFLESMRMLNQAGFNYINICDYAAGPIGVEYTANLLTLCRQAGFNKIGLMGSEHFFNAKSFLPENSDKLKESLATLASRYTQASSKAKELGFNEFYIYGFDEPHTDHGIAVCNEICRVAKAAQAKTIVACIFENVRLRLTNLDSILMSYMSMTSNANSFLDNISNGQGSNYQKNLYYANLTNEFLKESRLTYGWYLAKSKMDGNVAWALYYLHSDWEPFKDLSKDFPHATAYYVFPTKDKPIQTLKFLAACAGVNDMRYIETLNMAILESKDTAKAQAAKAKLDKMLETFEVYNDKGIYSNNFKVSAETYDTLQEQLQELIIQIKGGG
jgi:hypothetical protein